MALTKLSFNQINSNSAQFSSGVINVNTEAKEISENIGFIFNRDGGTTSNVGIMFNNATNSFVCSETISTANTVELGQKVDISVKSVILENTDNKKDSVLSIQTRGTKNTLVLDGQPLINGGLLQYSDKSLFPESGDSNVLYCDMSSSRLYKYMDNIGYSLISDISGEIQTNRLPSDVAGLVDLEGVNGAFGLVRKLHQGVYALDPTEYATTEQTHKMCEKLNDIQQAIEHIKTHLGL